MASGSNTKKTKHKHVASTKVHNLANEAELELPSHREAWTQAHCQHAAAASTNPSSTVPTSAPFHKCSSALAVDEVDRNANDLEAEAVGGDTSATAGMDHTFLILLLTYNLGPSKWQRVASPSPLLTSSKPEQLVLSAKDKTQDVNEFFDPPVAILGKKY